MRPLVIDALSRIKISQLVDKATKNPVDFATIRLAVEGKIDLANGRNRDFRIDLGFGYHVVYTHEENVPGVICRHFSISIPVVDKVPNPYAISILLQEFGFVNSLDKVYVYTENISDGGIAVNALEPLDGDMSKILSP